MSVMISKCKVVPVQTMMATSCHGHFIVRKELWYQLNRMLGLPQTWTGHFGGNISCPS